MEEKSLRRNNYQLGDEVSQTTAKITLWRNERSIVEIQEGTLTIPIQLDGKSAGCVFHGEGRFLLDAIAETDQGAIGEPIDKAIDKAFMMLGDTAEVQKYLTTADQGTLAKHGYADVQAFASAAQDLLDDVFDDAIHRRSDSREYRGYIFAFPNEKGRFDMLVAKGRKMVYKGDDTSFVSKEDKVILESAGEVVISRSGKSVFVRKNRVHIHS